MAETVAQLLGLSELALVWDVIRRGEGDRFGPLAAALLVPTVAGAEVSEEIDEIADALAGGTDED